MTREEALQRAEDSWDLAHDRWRVRGGKPKHATFEDHFETTADLILEVERQTREQALEPYRWRPIAEMHEDCGSCVLMDIDDAGDLAIGSNLDTDFDESLWTHFAEVPKLTNEEAEKLIAAMEPRP